MKASQAVSLALSYKLASELQVQLERPLAIGVEHSGSGYTVLLAASLPTCVSPASPAGAGGPCHWQCADSESETPSPAGSLPLRLPVALVARRRARANLNGSASGTQAATGTGTARQCQWHREWQCLIQRRRE